MSDLLRLTLPQIAISLQSLYLQRAYARFRLRVNTPTCRLIANAYPSCGFVPAAVFPDRFLALLAAAVIPGTGRDRLLRLHGEEGSGGFPVQLDDGETVGHLRLFDEPLLDALNVAVHLVCSPQSLAYLLEATGAVALERCGATLDSRVSEEGA